MGSLRIPRKTPWIRLLKLPPLGSLETQYELITVQLHDHPSYKAISYAWGDPVSTETVSIVQDNDQGCLEIPMNLSHALRAIRHDTEDVLVWADSICINQQSNREKTNQLPLIPDIYSKAAQVVLWLGIEKDDSARAYQLLHGLIHDGLQLGRDTDLGSVVSLFDRDYWSRLWVVQEILHATDIVVQCGVLQMTWDDYTQVSRLFETNKDSLAKMPTLARGSSDPTRLITSQHGLSPLQILIHHGPASISRIQHARELYSGDPDSLLLHILRLSRTKLASDPKDRVYGILGILPNELRDKFRVNYQLPIKEIYIDVVEILLGSGHVDVICESIHFPAQISNANLPSWVPDWSHDPMARSLASFSLSFSAGSRELPYVEYHEERLAPPTRSKLLITGVRIGTIETHGVTVQTLSRAGEWCWSFWQWRMLLLKHFGISSGYSDDSEENRRCRVVNCEQQRRFCLTLSLGKPIRTDSGVTDVELVDKEKEWIVKCYSAFAKTIRARQPVLRVDDDLRAFLDMDDNMEPEEARRFLQHNFADAMMGRCFCITDSGCLGLGTGAMACGDVVVVPYGCSTPVLLRPEGYSSGNGDGWRPQEYRFIGDAYIHGYMDGEAMQKGPRENFVLH